MEIGNIGGGVLSGEDLSGGGKNRWRRIHFFHYQIVIGLPFKKLGHEITDANLQSVSDRLSRTCNQGFSLSPDSGLLNIHDGPSEEIV